MLGVYQVYMPELHNHFDLAGIPVQILSQNYLQLCFIGSLPPVTVLRVMDLLMLTCIDQSLKPITILCAAFMTLMESSRDSLLEIDDINPEQAVNIVKFTV